MFYSKIIVAFIITFYISDAEGQTIKMTKKDGVYEVPCTINGLNLSFILDTGASNVVISLTEALFMLKNGHLKESDILEVEKYRIANGQITEGAKMVIRELRIGELEIQNVEATIIKNTNAPLLFGVSALKRLGSIEIDYDKETITIINSKGKSQLKTKEVNKENKLSPINKHMISAYANIEVKNYHNAINDLNNALKFDSYDARAYILRAACKGAVGDYNGLAQDYIQTVCTDPTYNSDFMYKDKLNDAIQSIDTFALRNFTKQTFSNETRQEGYFILAWLKHILKDGGGASKALMIALENNPTNPKTYLILGMTKMDRDDHKEAISYYNRAIELDPKNGTAYRLRGYAKMNLKDFRGAISDLNQAIENDPNNYGDFRTQGFIFQFLKDFKNAEDKYNQSIALNSRDYKSYYQRGILRIKSGKKYEGCNDLSIAADLGYLGAYDSMAVLCKQ